MARDHVHNHIWVEAVVVDGPQGHIDSTFVICAQCGTFGEKANLTDE